jgi:adenylate cyclase
MASMRGPSRSTTSSKGKSRVTVLLVCGSFCLALLSCLLFVRVVEPVDARFTDLLLRIRGSIGSLRPVYDPTMVHVDINNTTVQQLNNFYLSRQHYARVINNLAAMGTAAQVFDLIFAARAHNEEDQALIDAVRSAGNVYFGMAFTLSGQEGVSPTLAGNGELTHYLADTSWRIPIEGDGASLPVGTRPLGTFPALAAASKGVGFLTIKPDHDGVFRRLPILVRYRDALYPSLPFRVACDYLGVTPDRIRLVPGSHITLRGAVRPGSHEAGEDIVIPVDRYGNMVINFLGPWGIMKHYNFSDVLKAGQDRDELELWREELRGKIVLISDVSTGSADLGPAPTDVNYPLSGLHISVLHTILTKSFLRQWTPIQMLALELGLFSIVLLLGLRCSSIGFIAGAVALALGYLAAAAVAFLYGHWILQVVRPSVFIVLAAGSVTVHRFINGEKEKAVLRRTFEAYFPPSVVRKIIAHPDMLLASGHKKELTVLFSDIENFTAHSEQLSPYQIQRYLNEYFEEMVEIVFSHKGTVDKYIGDGLMVFFGDPDPQPDHALQCVLAAVAMQKKARELRRRWEEEEGGIPLRIRIGINTGEVVVGNMGSARRLSYTVLGSAVNLAQRLESSAPPGGIMISERTNALVCGQVDTRSLGRIQLKGIEEEVRVHEVVLDAINDC